MKTLRWVVVNGLIAGLLWWGLACGVTGARNVGMAATWFAVVVSLLACQSRVVNDLAADKKWPETPVWAEATYDMAIFALLAWYGWFVTAAAWAFHTMAVFGIYARVAKIREAAKSGKRC